MKLASPFIQLPFRFDVDRLSEEINQFDTDTWMAHPNRLTGNSAIPLVSVRGEDNDEFAGEMRVTPHLRRCEYIQQVMASFDEVIARSRLMRLAPGCEVSPHVDFNYHWYSRVRIHIPIVTQAEVLFYCGDDTVHMAAGDCWIFDSWRRHKVSNNGDRDRVHLVIDTAGSARFWRMIDAMSGPTESQPDFQEVSYQPGYQPGIRTERYSTSPVMSPGELEAMTSELIDDFKANPDNDPRLVEHYQALLRDLAKDWRAIWLEYGIQEAGFPRYQALLNETVKKLAPHPRALVAQSNNVGVNPIIMQRILRASLFPDQRQLFVNE